MKSSLLASERPFTAEMPSFLPFDSSSNQNYHQIAKEPPPEEIDKCAVAVRVDWVVPCFYVHHVPNIMTTDSMSVMK